MSKVLKIIEKRREKKFEFDKDAKFYFTSDTHYGHGNIMRYCKRPFFVHDDEKEKVEKGQKFTVSKESINNMNDQLVERFNKLVKPNDVLIHHGDFAWHPFKNSVEFIERLNCKNLFLIWGNHDEAELGNFIPNNYDQCLIKLEGVEIHSNHYPQDTWESSHRGSWHLFGHVHGAANSRRELNPAWSMSLDCGVDSHDFRPWEFQELRSHFEKKYDRWKQERDGWKDKEEGGMAPK